MLELSVIIPVYNRPELLREAVQSVFAQTFTDYELIIVDDGSTDETAAVAVELADSEASGGRCRVLTVSHSGCAGAARNRGTEAAQGRYIAFLDSDDTWMPEKLELQLSLMKSAGYKISHTREQWLRGEKTVSQKGQKHKREGDIFADALKKCIIGPSTTMMERVYYFESGGFHEDLEIAEDYEYWLRITCGQLVGYVGETLTVKRAGGWSQLSEKYGKIEWFRICALAGLLNVRIPGFGLKADYLSGYEWLGFNNDARAAAITELIFKCELWSAGCKKRGRISESDEFDAIINACKMKL